MLGQQQAWIDGLLDCWIDGKTGEGVCAGGFLFLDAGAGGVFALGETLSDRAGGEGVAALERAQRAAGESGRGHEKAQKATKRWDRSERR